MARVAVDVASELTQKLLKTPPFGDHLWVCRRRVAPGLDTSHNVNTDQTHLEIVNSHLSS